MGGYDVPSLAAMSIWIGKNSRWKEDTDIQSVILTFLSHFHFSDQEKLKLFDNSMTIPLNISLLSTKRPDLRTISYEFQTPPDAPNQTEGTLSSVSLRGIGPAKSFDLKFGDRLTLISGDNGLGKSFLLDVAWWALTNTWAGYPAFPSSSAHSRNTRLEFKIRDANDKEVSFSSRFDWNTFSWKSRKNRQSVAAVSIYARVDGSFAIADEIRGKLRTNNPDSLNLFSTKEVWDGKPGEIEGLIRDWVNWLFSDERDSFAMLERVLEHLSPEDVGPLRPSKPVRIPGDPRQIPRIQHAYGHVPVIFASAGVQRVLLLAYLIIWSWREHLLAAEQAGVEHLKKMVIIVDEIEAHLHPKWQRLVLPSLLSVGKLLSEQLDIQVIASTHSPMVLASIEEEFSNTSDMLAHLRLVDSTVTLDNLEFYKYGDMSSWLMSPLFGLTHARSKTAEKVIEEAKRIQLLENATLEDVKDITMRLKQSLAPDDGFWSRWIYYAKSKGDEI